MSTDRELLELAAKAAGIAFEFCRPELGGCLAGGRWWNPLTDDGDALRLAVKLRLIVEPGACWISKHGPAFGEDVLAGVMTATRRAIVRAAAEIGRAME